MDFAAEAAKLDENAEQTLTDNQTASIPDEPTPDQVRNYIVSKTNLTEERVKQKAQTRHNNCQFVSELSAYYLVALDYDLDPATVFGTRDQNFDLDIANIRPEMTVTIEATVRDVAVENPDTTDWRRQDIQLIDDTGEIELVLWNEDVRTDLSTGDDLKLIDCWAKTYNGSTQLSLGKNGRIEQPS